MIILASSSPRRQQLLRRLIPSFSIEIPDIDEASVPGRASALPQETSRLKAYKVFHHHPEAIVLACDTIVFYKDRQLGKPGSEEEAKMMLRLLSGNKHKVISGYTLIGPNFEVNRTVVTIVRFHELSDSFIDDYVKNKKPLDKAGAYGIQDEGYNLVESIDGSYFNVMGLPLEDIESVFRKMKING